MSNAQWALVDSWIFATHGAVAQKVVQNLEDYDDIMVMLVGVTCSDGVTRNIQVSTNNGSSFLSGTEYITCSDSADESTAANIPLHATGSALARSGGILIMGWALTHKFWRLLSRTNTSIGMGYIDVSAAINALRIFPTTGTFTGGAIYIYGR